MDWSGANFVQENQLRFLKGYEMLELVTIKGYKLDGAQDLGIRPAALYSQS